jgi:hypothetical protein
MHFSRRSDDWWIPNSSVRRAGSARVVRASWLIPHLNPMSRIYLTPPDTALADQPKMSTEPTSRCSTNLRCLRLGRRRSGAGRCRRFAHDAESPQRSPGGVLASPGNTSPNSRSMLKRPPSSRSSGVSPSAWISHGMSRPLTGTYSVCFGAGFVTVSLIASASLLLRRAFHIKLGSGTPQAKTASAPRGRRSPRSPRVDRIRRPGAR